MDKSTLVFAHTYIHKILTLTVIQSKTPLDCTKVAQIS